MNDILTWNQTFMEIAETIARRSKDPNTKVGALIVNKENKVIAMGYNGFPRTPGKKQNDAVFPWSRSGKTKADTKYCYVIHAEVNAILNATTHDLSGATLYVTRFPCCECAKIICQKRIGKIYYQGKIDEDPNGRYCMLASMKMFRECQIPFYRLEKPLEIMSI